MTSTRTAALCRDAATLRLDRLAVAMAALRFELDDNGPRLQRCATAECPSLTRARLCLVCREEAGKAESRKQKAEMGC